MIEKLSLTNYIQIQFNYWENKSLTGFFEKKNDEKRIAMLNLPTKWKINQLAKFPHKNYFLSRLYQIIYQL